MSPGFTSRWITPDPARVDVRADIYGLGLTWFECLTGKHPLAGGSFAEWQRAHLDSHRPLLEREDVPAPHRRLLHAMIACEVDHRPPTMAAVLRRLEPAPRAGGWLLGALLDERPVAETYRAKHADGREAIVTVFTRASDHERELAVRRAVQHEGIAALVDSSPDGDEDRYLAIAAERRETLAELLARGPLPVALPRRRTRDSP